jgi:hypothetical protein
LFGNLVDEEKVIFTGFLKGEELAQAYACGDIFLHCSITETFGLVVLESMASGVPVIARDEGGPCDIIADGKSGFLVPPNDLDQFVSRILQLQDSDLRREMGLVSRTMAEQATWEAINHTVAVRMAEELEDDVTKQHVPQENNQALTFPVYSWLLLNPTLREVFVASIVDFKLVGCLWVITGIWAGLIATWISVQVALFVKARYRRTGVPS